VKSFLKNIRLSWSHWKVNSIVLVIILQIMFIKRMQTQTTTNNLSLIKVNRMHHQMVNSSLIQGSNTNIILHILKYLTIFHLHLLLLKTMQIITEDLLIMMIKMIFKQTMNQFLWEGEE